VALIRTDVSEDRIASIFRVHECEQVTELSCKLLYRHRLVRDIACLSLDSKLADLDTSALFDSEIHTSRSQAEISCILTFCSCSFLYT
jgi:hypothetical protein